MWPDTRRSHCYHPKVDHLPTTAHIVMLYSSNSIPYPYKRNKMYHLSKLTKLNEILYEGSSKYVCPFILFTMFWFFLFYISMFIFSCWCFLCLFIHYIFFFKREPFSKNPRTIIYMCLFIGTFIVEERPHWYNRPIIQQTFLRLKKKTPEPYESPTLETTSLNVK